MIGLIAGREIRERVCSRGFWLTTTGIPLLLLALWGISSMLVGQIDRPLEEVVEVEELEWVVGYVDEAGVIKSIPSPAPADSFRQFATREAASVALARGRSEPTTSFLRGMDVIRTCSATATESQRLRPTRAGSTGSWSRTCSPKEASAGPLS